MQPDLRVETVPIEQLLAYAANARTHSDEQVVQIAASMAEFGFVNPVLIDDTGTLIAGHGRLLAAKKLGMETAPAIRLGHLTEAQARAFRVADNKIALNAGWDAALLKAELLDLTALGFDMNLVGFSPDELSAMLAGGDTTIDEEAADDPATEPPAEPVTRPGDLWLLGEHRLLCGDSTSATDVERLLDGARPHLLVSDPPFGVNYDPAWRNEAGVSRTARTGRVLNDHRADWRETWSLFPGDVAYVWHAGVHARTVIESLEAAEFKIRSQIIWAKPRLVLGRGDYHYQHEPCLYAVRDGKTGHWQGARDQTTLWSIATRGDDVEDPETVHGTQKPVECMRRPILNNSAPGDVVYEPFSGSGTTLIAAEMTGRRCLAMEINPAYCDVAVRRWQDLTGRAAILDGDNRPFNEIAATSDEPVAA
ncbi:MAG: site-specific DNA-methyltransferase [Acetobacteraceae bacterium]